MPRLTAQQVAQRLGIARSTAYALPIPRYKHGTAVRFDEADVLAYEESCRSTTTPASAAGDSNFAARLPVDPSGLGAFFRRAGLVPKPKPSTAANRRGSGRLHLAYSSSRQE